MNIFAILIVQIFLVSSVCQAQSLTMAQPGLWAGNRVSSSVGNRELLDTLAEGVQRTESIELEAQKRKTLFSPFKAQKSFRQVQEERQKRIRELRQEIIDSRSKLGENSDSSLSALESELAELLTKQAKAVITGEIQNPVEELFNSDAGLLEKAAPDSYLVPGMWMVPTGGSPGGGGQGSSSETFTALKDQDSVSACEVCKKDFGVFRWKYNCFTCGEVVCDDCSKSKITTNGYSEQQTACKPCVDQYQAWKNSRSQSERVRELCGQFEAQAREDSSSDTGAAVAEGFLEGVNNFVPPPFDLIISAAQKVLSLARTSTVNTAESRRLSNRVARLSCAVIKLSTQTETPLAQRAARDLLSAFNDSIELLEKFQPDGTRTFVERMRCKWMQYSSETVDKFNEIHNELTTIMNDRAFALSMEDKKTLAAPTMDEIKEGLRQELNHVVEEVRRVGSETGERLDQIASDLHRVQGILGGSNHRNVVLDPRSVQVDTQTVLGQGAFGTVYAGRLYGSTPVAIKVMSNLEGRSFEQLRREVELTMLVNNPKVVKVYGLLPSTQPGTYPAIIMERLGNSLESEISGLSDQLKLKYTLDIIEGMAKVHDSKLTHFDLKPENVMLSEDKKRAKIIDFGISQTRSTIRVSGPSSPRGTFQYMAPEMFTGGRCGSACDVYSFGILLYELWSGEKAWHGRPADVISSCVKDGNRPATFQEMEEAGVPNSIASLIEASWRQTPGERPTFRQMEEIEDDFLESSSDHWPSFLEYQASFHSPVIGLRPALPSWQQFERFGNDALREVLGAQDIHEDILSWLRDKKYNGRQFISSGRKMIEQLRSEHQFDELHIDDFDHLHQRIHAQHQEAVQREQVRAEAAKKAEESRLAEAARQKARQEAERIEAARKAEDARRVEEARLAAARRPSKSVARTKGTRADPLARAVAWYEGPREAQRVGALEWELGRKGSKRMTFEEAQAYAANRAGEGWRLPTIWELEALYQQRSVLGDDLDIGWCFWSSTAVVGSPNGHWRVGFDGGDVNSYHDAYSYQVRLVRGGREDFLTI